MVLRLADRFWSKVDVRSSGECWTWLGSSSPNRDGMRYGRFGVGGRGVSPKLAHRVVFELEVCPIPSGMMVLHRCDNPLCVNPAHLFLGTHEDNMRDMAEKGRARAPVYHGEKHPNAKLTEADVLVIRARYVAGHHGNVRALADEFGVTTTTIGNVATGRQRKGSCS